jgi:predicted MFS family arabinose efflux permease
LGFVGGSYTLAAAVAGIVGAFALDRFQRKRAFMFSVLGLAVGTALGALAQDLSTMIIARMVAGAFGGQATALSLSILADVVPKERRGVAMGRVMGAFALASILGVPTGLELARLGNWRTPFLVVGALGLLAALAIRTWLPELRSSRPIGAPTLGASWLLKDRTSWIALSATALVYLGGFSIIPHLSTFVQHNLNVPREHLGVLYLAGGITSFFAMRAAGKLADRRGPHVVTVLATALLLSIFAFGFLPAHPGIPPVVLFMGLMVSNSVRGVALSSLSTQVPSAEARARFMSANSTVQHAAAASGALLSSVVLFERADHTLGGMPELATFAMTTASLVPILVWLLASRLRTRATAAVPSAQ